MTKIIKGRKRILAGLCLGVVAVIVLAANGGRILVVDAPEKSDVILVLAGETDHRPARALELFDQGFGQTVVIDVPSAEKIYDVTQIQLAEHYAQSLAQFPHVKVCPIAGLSTKEESHDAEKCLAREPGKKVLIVTSDFHTRRALSIFRHELPNRSFSIAASHDSTQFGTRWWTHRQWAKIFFEEGTRLIWWTLVDRWK